MNSLESRWLRIKRFDQHDLDAMHSVERDADLKWREHYPNGRYADAGDGWEVAGVRYMDKLDRRLGPYFDSGKLETEKAMEILNFQNCPVVRRMFAKMEATELADQAYLAQADFEIHSKAYTPNYGKGSSANRDKLAALYQKADKPIPYQD